MCVRVCVVIPLHEWATGSLPPAGRLPTRQVGPCMENIYIAVVIYIYIYSMQPLAFENGKVAAFGV